VAARVVLVGVVGGEAEVGVRSEQYAEQAHLVLGEFRDPHVRKILGLLPREPEVGGIGQDGRERDRYDLIHFAANGMTIWVASDLAGAELAEFVRL
jgi:hypothetical protein